eukprot:TRINITY_DN124112_c0_g1_i1.p1 TRINITY_DN124112_c0_g1~~TRINITY_DN124112_c0_g1_i1.p1  ORF type:complete len:470 (-),score=103.18 TRINITY_DN124112_c0_g1_i1:65-1474(-)
MVRKCYAARAWLPRICVLVQLQLFLRHGHAQAPPASPVAGLYAEHGTDWTEGQCASRLYQSPISIDHGLKEPQADVFRYHYNPIVDASSQLVAKNGTLSIDFTGKQVGKVVYKKTLFELQRLDIRGAAEHLIKGTRYPLEMQLVHKKISEGGLDFTLVISVLLWCETFPVAPPPGSAPVMLAATNPGEMDFNPALLPLTQQPPPSAEGAAAPIPASPQAPLDLGMLIEDRTLPEAQKEDTPFMGYSGSLTTPPCQESAWWLVRRDPLIAATAQVTSLANSLFALTANQGNFRHVMPLNKRKAIVVGPVWEAALGVPGHVPEGIALGPEPLIWGQGPRTDGELRAHNAAKKASTKAQHAAAAAKDLANRLAEGERAFAHQLEEPPLEAHQLLGAAAPEGPAQVMARIMPAAPGLAPAIAKALEVQHPKSDMFVRAAAGEMAAMPIRAAGQMLRGQAAAEANVATQQILYR